MAASWRATISIVSYWRDGAFPRHEEIQDGLDIALVESLDVGEIKAFAVAVACGQAEPEAGVKLEEAAPLVRIVDDEHRRLGALAQRHHPAGPGADRHHEHLEDVDDVNREPAAPQDDT